MTDTANSVTNDRNYLICFTFLWFSARGWHSSEIENIPALPKGEFVGALGRCGAAHKGVAQSLGGVSETVRLIRGVLGAMGIAQQRGHTAYQLGTSRRNAQGRPTAAVGGGGKIVVNYPPARYAAVVRRPQCRQIRGAAHYLHAGKSAVLPPVP